MQPRDLRLLRIPSDPRVHPDGVRVAFVVTRPDLDEDDYAATIWQWDGEHARPFTQGRHDTQPRWSPDGRWLAFLRRLPGDGERPQVHVMPADGGEARPVTDLPLGANDVVWSPDSSRLVVTGRTWTSAVQDWSDDERKKRPKRITELGYRREGPGFVHDKRLHLFLTDLDTPPGDERHLTSGDEDDEYGVTWHPDGRTIAFLTNRHPDREVVPGDEIWTMDVETGQQQQLAEVGDWSQLAYAPDGTLHAVGLPDSEDWPCDVPVHRWVDGRFEDLTSAHGWSAEPAAPHVEPHGPQFVEDGFLLPVEDAGRVRVVRWRETGVEDVLGGDRCVTGVSARPDGAFAFTVTDTGSPGELGWYEDGQERVLTDLNAEFLAQVEVLPTEHFRYPSESGEVDAWVVQPPGDGPAPVLLNIHGGPTSQYGFYFFDEFQVYAAAGYLVVGVNPRGSSGRGTAWARGVVGAWRELDSIDTRDLLAAVDEVLARYDRADASRLGIMGGSYGGYATARICAVDHRFHSAVVERGLLQWESFAGTSDIGAFFDRMYLGAALPEGVEVFRSASPTPVAHRITTPTLVLHSESDLRCPIEQAEQFFAALRRAGVASEFVRFPDENHELSRSGAPRHRLERFDIILEWHGRRLGIPWELDSLVDPDAGADDGDDRA